MHWKDVFNGLDLNDDCVLDEKINAIAKRDADAVINDRKWFFSFEYHPHACQFVRHACFVRPLEQART